MVAAQSVHLVLFGSCSDLALINRLMVHDQRLRFGLWYVLVDVAAYCDPRSQGEGWLGCPKTQRLSHWRTVHSPLFEFVSQSLIFSRVYVCMIPSSQRAHTADILLCRLLPADIPLSVLAWRSMPVRQHLPQQVNVCAA